MSDPQTTKQEEIERLLTDALEMGKSVTMKRAQARVLQREIDEDRRNEAAKIPVDRSARVLTNGSEVTPDHQELKDNGQQKGYVVLSDAERAKGFVRPVRESYIHEKCGILTSMGRALAETYARDPHFYSGTFCCGCRKHFSVGEDGEFVWADTNEKVGT